MKKKKTQITSIEALKGLRNDVKNLYWELADDGPRQSEVSRWVEIHGGKLRLYDGNVEHCKTSTDAKWRWSSGSIDTLEGVMTVKIGDYIIKGVKGEFYPCKPDIFEATYDQV